MSSLSICEAVQEIVSSAMEPSANLAESLVIAVRGPEALLVAVAP